MAAKKDAINIAPFVDILLVLFVIILVSATFSDDSEYKKNEKLKRVIEELHKEKDILQEKLDRYVEETRKTDSQIKRYLHQIDLLKKDNLTLTKKLESQSDRNGLVVIIERDGRFNVNGTRLSPQHMYQFIKLFKLDLEFRWPKRVNKNIYHSLEIIKRAYKEIGGSFDFK